MAVLLGLLCAGLAIVLWAGDAVLDLGFDGEAVVAANVGLFLIGLLFGAFALALGCAFGRPGLARGIAIGTALAAFLINALGLYSDWFAPLRPLSPFAWYLGDRPPLTRGFGSGHLLLALVTSAWFGIAVLTIGRRDLRR
jgi:ABC-2 type transport system permease protein